MSFKRIEKTILLILPMNNRNFIHRLIILLMLLNACIYQPIFARKYSKDCAFRTIDLNTHNIRTIYNIEQDTLGYIWIRSGAELLKYNGSKFESILHIPNDSTSLSSNIIRNIMVDSGGDLWITTANGVNKYNYYTGGFKLFTHSHSDSNSMYHNSTYGIVECTNNYIWVSGWHKSLSRIEKKTNTVKRYHLKNNIDSECYRYIRKLENGKLCLFTDNNQIVIFDPITEKEEIIEPPLPHEKQWSWVFEDPEGYYLFSSCSGNYALYDYQYGDFKKLTNYPNYQYFKGLNINHITKDKNGNTLISTNKRLLIFNSNGKFITSITLRNNSGKPSGIQTSFVDRDDNLWLASDKQLWISGPYQGQVTMRKHVINKNTGSYCNSFVSEDTVINLHLKAINKYIPETGYNNIYSYPENDKQIMNLINRFSLSDSMGIKWLNTNINGVYKLDNNKLTHYNGNSEKNIFETNTINKIIVDKNGFTWIVTYNNGLFRFVSPNKYEHYTHNEHDSTSINNNWFFDSYLDNFNQLWFASWDGLALYRDDSNNFERYIFGDYIIVHAIKKRSDSTIYLASNKGLLVFNTFDKELVKTYNSQNVLTNDFITQIEIDNEGRVWIMSKAGLSIFNEKTQTCIDLNSFDGLHNLDNWANKSFKNDKGYIFFNNKKVQYFINPSKFQPNPTRLKTIISEFRLFNKPVKIGEIDGYNKRIEFVNKVKIKHNQSYFSIYYSALGYSDVSRYRYQYKLENYNKEWIDAGEINHATYTNINPGEYTFKVRCINEHKVIGHTTELKIEIVPPFWMRLWFDVLCTLIVILLIYFLFRWRLHRLEKNEVRLEKMIHERTLDLKEKNKELTTTHQTISLQKHELELKSNQLEVQKNDLEIANKALEIMNSTRDKFYSIISHDIKTPFNGIIGISDLLLQNLDSYPREKLEKYIRLIYNSSKSTYDLLENLLTWSRSQTGKINFKPHLLDVSRIIQDLFVLFDTTARNKKITLKNSVEEGLKIYADEQMIKTILRNLIANAIKYTKSGGEVFLANVASENETRFSIKDTGIGMDPKTLQSLFKLDLIQSKTGTGEESGTGLGLILCYEFVKYHQGKIWAESSLGKGSTFHFSIPNTID